MSGLIRLIKRCEICGREFAAKRNTARFCSATCRKRNARGYAYDGKLLPPEPSCAMTESEVLDVVRCAHDAANDLSRASLMTSYPLCESLGNAAKGIEDVLRGEGL